MNFKARTLKKNSFIFGFGRGAQVGEASFLEVNLRRKRRRWAYHFYLVRFRPWDPTKPRFWKKTKHFLTMRSKIVRRLPSWQRSGVVSQQRLRLRRFDSLVKRSPKLRSEPVSFLFLVCFFYQFFWFVPCCLKISTGFCFEMTFLKNMKQR